MIGRTISHYRIVEKLGEGGMGVVYKAEDLKLHRSVALKTLSEQSAEFGARLRIEAEAAAGLNHPNICTVYEIDEEHQLLAMEFVDGETVAAKLKARPLPLEEALRIAIQAAQGLQAAHESGVIHRDIKCSNIMVSSRGQVKVMDFGLARIAEHPRLTSSGALIGTPAYMSPEQAEGKPVDRRTDVWSLGVVLYEMISGQPPFRGEAPASTIHAILHKQPEPLTALRTGLPIELDRIVSKALAKNPAERYQHVDEMLVDLNHVAKPLGKPPSANPSLGSRSLRYAYFVAAVLAGLIVLAILLPRDAWRGILGPSDQGSTAALAVLPLDDLSGASDRDYFSDGMTDALINELGTIGSLRVISRTSVMRYKGTRQSLSKIASELGVDHILEGTVVQAGDRVRVSARLIRAAREQQVWTRTYEREMNSVLALQREVAQSVASEIGVRFTAASPAKAATVKPEAYDAYLLGLQHWNNPPQRVRQAMEAFERAIRLDPKFAPAYAWLARCWVVGGSGRSNSRREVGQRAEELATQALALDEANADAHSVLGYVKTYFDYDWDGAERSYRRALELNHSLSDAYHRYSHYLMIVGKFEEGLRASRRGIDLSPYDRTIVGHHVWTLYMARRYQEAARYAESVLAVDAESFYARLYSYRVYEHLREYQRILDSKPSNPERARALALSGNSAEARRLLEEMLRDTTGVNAPFGIALVYLALGEKDKTLDWLEQGYDRRVYPLPDIRVDARFDSLRSEKRFQELLRRMGLDATPPPVR